MSKTGLWLCAIYAAIIAACIGSIFLHAGYDTESKFILLQLPIAPQSALIAALGLMLLLKGVSWPVAYVLLAGPVFCLLYGLGMLIDRRP